MKDEHLSYLLIQANINNENQFMVFSDSSWKDCTYAGRSTVQYIIFYQGGPIDDGTYVLGPVAKLGVESEYNAACNA